MHQSFSDSGLLPKICGRNFEEASKSQRAEVLLVLFPKGIRLCPIRKFHFSTTDIQERETDSRKYLLFLFSSLDILLEVGDGT